MTVNLNWGKFFQYHLMIFLLDNTYVSSRCRKISCLNNRKQKQADNIDIKFKI